MKTVAVFLSDDLTIRRLSNAFGDRCIVRAFSDVNDLKDFDKDRGLLVSIVDMSHHDHFEIGVVTDLISRLRSAYRVVPIIAYLEFSPERARDIMAAAHAGASDIILRDVDNLSAAAIRIVKTERLIDVTWTVNKLIQNQFPEEIRELIIYAVKHGSRHVTVDDAAKELRRNRKTLVNWLSKAGLPPPFRIIGWGRVLVAAKLLEDKSRSLEDVAREMRFQNGNALRGMIRRYLEVLPEEVRAVGGFEFAVSRFASTLDLL